MGVELHTLTVKVESLELENHQLKDDILALKSNTTEGAAVCQQSCCEPADIRAKHLCQENCLW